MVETIARSCSFISMARRVQTQGRPVAARSSDGNRLRAQRHPPTPRTGSINTPFLTRYLEGLEDPKASEAAIKNAHVPPWTLD
ncbi:MULTISPECIES: hypothetical protein [Rhizobium]|uniref:Uncharacterized protein n=1 Tax=Rhizobium paranaense TaxID=1650438 RepID=A0A7W9D3W1_9HYPH|nr:hypothetical protein [Rhizobium paranaense]MBB5576605.1 hypothetical protein [Rhizobium paranaense]